MFDLNEAKRLVGYCLLLLPFSQCSSLSYGTIALGRHNALITLSTQRISLRNMMFVGTDREHGYETDFWHSFLSINCAIIDDIALNVDFFYFPYTSSPYPWREYTNYTIGYGAKIQMLQTKTMNICGVFNLRHYIDIDRSWDHHHKYYQERFASIVVGHQWQLPKFVVEAHLGPCYLYYRSEDYYGGGEDWTTFLETGYPFGCFGGLESIVMKHLNIEGDIFVTRGLGALLTIGYRF